MLKDPTFFPFQSDERRKKKCILKLKLKFCYRFYAIVKMGKNLFALLYRRVIRCKRGQGHKISIRSNGAKRTKILKSVMNLRNVLHFTISTACGHLWIFHQRGLNCISHFACSAASVLDCKNNCFCWTALFTIELNALQLWVHFFVAKFILFCIV